MPQDRLVCHHCHRPIGHESRTYGHPEDVATDKRPRPRAAYHLACWLAAYQEMTDRGDQEQSSDVDL